MFLGLAGLLLVIYLVLLIGVHVTGGLIHLLVVLAVISVVMHFLVGRRS